MHMGREFQSFMTDGTEKRDRCGMSFTKGGIKSFNYLNRNGLNTKFNHS